jgi:excisionase family DNA binding protein
MSKITLTHLDRTAYVYIRQSTPGQLQLNPESRRRQYGLAERAQTLGWQNVVVLDEDLGRSGGGTVRPGFERLLSAICTGNAGAVLAVEASRLARNGRDWHTLLEFCAIVDCLIIDEDGVYDARLMNDRLLLGMKGTFSELELSLLRQRSQEALRLKAERGDLHTIVAVGFCRSADDRVEKDPDRRIQAALDLVFRKFKEVGSVRQLTLWLRQEAIELPVARPGRRGGVVTWCLPRYNTVHRILTNPVYAGAYVFGRTGSSVRLEGARKRILRGQRRPVEEWPVLIRDHHQGYISWEEYERNQAVIAANANMKGAMVYGAVRRGSLLLAGLLRCGHCGRRLHVFHNDRRLVGRYACVGANLNHGVSSRCIAFGNMRIDAAVSAEVLRVISPLGLTAALAVIEERQHAQDDRLRQAELAVEQARYEVDRARCQYDAVDPGYRLVAAELERRWDERLRALAERERHVERLRAGGSSALSAQERAKLLDLGQDLHHLWHHPEASPEVKKRILRTVLEEIVVTAQPTCLHVKLHWCGGDHTALEVPRSRSGEHRWKTDVETDRLIRGLARQLPDPAIASLLNRLGIYTAKGYTWTQLRIRNYRCEHQIAIHHNGERAARGEVNLAEAAARLNVSTMTVTRLIRAGSLPAVQLCKGAPYVISEADLSRPEVKIATAGCPATSDRRQESFDFQ